MQDIPEGGLRSGSILNLDEPVKEQHKNRITRVGSFLVLVVLVAQAQGMH